MEVLKSVSTTIRFPALDADPVALTEPEVAIVRDSTGESVKEPPEPTKVESLGETFFELTLGPELTSEVDLLRVTWKEKAEEEGEAVNTYVQDVEVVGGFVVSVAEIKDKLGTDPAQNKVELAREIATREIESACGMAFRPRYRKDQLSGKGRDRLRLTRRELIRLIRIEVEETVWSKEQMEALTLDPSGVLDSESIWPEGASNIEVAYVYGMENFASAIGPVRDLAAYILTEHPSDWQGRATTFTNEFGNSYSLVTPGVRGAMFPLPSVNAFVQQFEEPLVA